MRISRTERREARLRYTEANGIETGTIVAPAGISLRGELSKQTARRHRSFPWQRGLLSAAVLCCTTLARVLPAVGALTLAGAAPAKRGLSRAGAATGRVFAPPAPSSSPSSPSSSCSTLSAAREIMGLTAEQQERAARSKAEALKRKAEREASTSGPASAAAPDGGMGNGAGEAPAEDGSLESTLQQYFGYGKFRHEQREVCQAVLDGRDVSVYWATGADVFCPSGYRGAIFNIHPYLYVLFKRGAEIFCNCEFPECPAHEIVSLQK